MGKSIRNKRNVRFRNIRREKIHASVEQERLQRLSEKLTGKKAEETMEVDDKKPEEKAQEAPLTCSDLTIKKKKKISTFEKRKINKRRKLFSL